MRNEPTELDDLITEVIARMDTMTSDSERYSEYLGYLERLCKLRDNERPQRVDRNIALGVLGNLTGILIIVGYERSNVLMSKAFSLITRAKT